MPRDFRTYRARLRSPPNSMARTNSQVSTMEEISTSVFSMDSPPEVRFVRKPVTSRCFRKVDEANQHGVCVAQVASLDQAADRIDHDDLRLEVVNNLVNDRQVHLKTEERGPAGMKLKQVFLAPLGARSMPIDCMFRMSCPGDSSKEK